MVSQIQQPAGSATQTIADLYESVRARTLEIVAPLEIEDYVIQTAEFMSPPRWHIGHTSWFFETVLQKYQPGYKVYSAEFLFYFNSYYEGFGARIERPKRGTRSRPTVAVTKKYRSHIDEQMSRFIAKLSDRDEGREIEAIVRLGLEHEMQHQELLVYDIKHLLCDQFDAPTQPAPVSMIKVEGMAEIEGGLVWLGQGAKDKNGDNEGPQEGHSKFAFAFDNEKPAHQVFLRDFAIGKAPVSNGEFLEFIRDGGYQNFRWWFSEGWETVNREHWRAPLYWEEHNREWLIRDFSGLHSIGSKADYPVSHISYFEASAVAKWAGKRLPTEAEWERAACYDSRKETKCFPWGDDPVDSIRANLFENALWSVAPIGAFPNGANANGCQQ